MTTLKKEMEKNYNHLNFEPSIAKLWEEKKCFTANVNSTKPAYTIILPPPNANGKLHVGHALMIAIEDLLIRFKKMQGYETLWIPGSDHAGFETQVVYEKELKKQGKSRFDFDNKTLYNDIFTFVTQMGDVIKNQVDKLGGSLDWSRYKFTLDPQVITLVYGTFEKLFNEGLIYKDDYIVNYSVFYGTTFADLEVEYKEQIDNLYYIKYFFTDSAKNGLSLDAVEGVDYITVATTRPEPIFVDTHLAINPKDEKTKYLLNKKVKNPLTNKEMSFIADDFVDIEFGTGIVKLTPAHDKNDFDVAKRHNLPIISTFTFEGKLNNLAGEFEGLKIKVAREKIVEKLTSLGFVQKINTNYKHSVVVDYKSGHDIEPMVVPNWFVQVANLKKAAHDAVKNGDVKIYPEWQETKYHRWMEDMRDWPISRQIVWGIRIPVWYDININSDIQITFLDESKKVVTGLAKDLLNTYSFEVIKEGLQKLIAPKNCTFVIKNQCPDSAGLWLQETDTFDTWFSSGHWPLVCTGFQNNPQDFNKFYPTAVLETGWEILRFWVSRMLMIGIYLTGKAPFSQVYLHGLVMATDGRKMSKSLGNQVDPLECVAEYGADALRMGLISGTATGHDFRFPKDKVIAYKNFVNKLWNMTRFMHLMFEKAQINNFDDLYAFKDVKPLLTDQDKVLLVEFNRVLKSVEDQLPKYRFAQAAEEIYHFLWGTVAASYIEHVKEREDKKVALSVLNLVFVNSLKLLHPFMPFITETLWSYVLKPKLEEGSELLIQQEWPKEFEV